MIVLGITPGVRSLAYCVLRLRKGAAKAELIDSDLLKGGRVQEGDDEGKILKKARPHNLILQIVIERAFDLDRKDPLIVAIGPGRPNDKEPKESALLVRVLLTGLCAELVDNGLRIVCLNWESADELSEVLGIPIKQAVNREFNSASTSHIRTNYVLCAGSALAAIKKVEQLQLVART